MSLQHTSYSLGGAAELFGYLLDRLSDQFLTRLLYLFLLPSAMISAPLKAMLDDEAPALIFCFAGTALKADDQFFELIARQHPGLGSHCVCIRPPLPIY
ncbi:hypothetical protein [Granulicella sp. L60]|uniref:hypothetical protein n=1 Tax=Granulicella sp. L60 TaxID=1641866 RepID=UPI00131B5AC5|nr:hypothetical protein [Granulicella sp. L60]